MEASCSIPDGVYPAGCAGCGEALEGLEVVLRGGHPFGARRDGAEVDDSSLPARRAECDMCGRETDVIDEATIASGTTISKGGAS